MRTVVITGASSGIGKEALLLFQKKGWQVIALVRKTEDQIELNKIDNVISYRLDVTQTDSISKCFENIIQKYKKIDVLINNAGIYDTKPFEFMPKETINDMVNTNYLSILHIINHCTPHFRKQRSGVIINISSLAGRITFPFQSLYHSTKWAIEGLTEGLFYELQPLGIKLKLIEPGMVKTNLYKNCKNLNHSVLPKEYIELFKKWFGFLMGNLQKGYSPTLDAKTIYKAATDGKNKLRYTSDLNTKILLTIKSVLPKPLFMRFIKFICKI